MANKKTIQLYHQIITNYKLISSQIANIEKMMQVVVIKYLSDIKH